jgi:hypothetical protein
MRPLSSTECISPAIERTKLILFTPFRKGRTWKLCATAYLAAASSVFMPFPFFYLAFLPMAREHGGTAIVVVILAIVAFVTLVYVLFFYLFTRLKFTWFDILVNRGEFVAPAWRKYGPQSLSWTVFKVVFGSLITLALSAPIAAYIRHLIPLFRSMTHGQQPTMQLIGAIYAGYGIVALVFAVLSLISGLLGDFIVPSLALEDTGLAEAFRRLFALIAGEPGEFALYTLLKTVLGMAAYMGAMFVWEVVFFIATLIVVLVFGGIGFALHLAGVPTALLIVPAVILAVAWYFFATFYTLAFAIGPVLTFLDAYALYFLGGRYPLLGDLLDRSTPPPTNAYPADLAPYPPPYYPPPSGPPPSLPGA